MENVKWQMAQSGGNQDAAHSHVLPFSIFHFPFPMTHLTFLVLGCGDAARW
jgi:hypothetical protein